MLFTHDHIQERMIDFLYGEIDRDARAAFEAHLSTCAACRSEVEALQQTRSAARALVREPLGQPLPPAVRARLIEAATRPMGSSAAPVAPGGTQLRPTNATAPDAERPPVARWLRWLRGRWTFPMFVTFAAMGALLLVRETVFREARHPLGQDPAAPLQSAPASRSDSPSDDRSSPQRASAPSPPVPADGRQRQIAASDRAGGEGEGGERESMVEARGDRSIEGGAASPPSAKNKRAERASVSRHRVASASADRPATPAKKSTTSVDDLLDDDGSRPLGGRHAQSSEAPAESHSAEAAVSAARAVSESVPNRVAEGERRQDDSEPQVSVPRPSTRSASAPIPAPAAAVRRSPPNPSPAAAPPSEPHTVTPAPRSKVPAPSLGAKAESAKMSDPPVFDARAARPPGNNVDSVAGLVDRAEKSMASSRWRDAAAAYRDLLRRFPAHPSASLWRRRLSLAEGQIEKEAGGGNSRSRDTGFAQPPPPK